MKLRPEVQAFAEAMERKLRENDHKGGWKHEDEDWLLDRLRQETNELEEAMDRKRRTILDEAADVANFAMMIADVSGKLAAARAGKERARE